MKINLDLDDSSFLIDLKGQVFIALLKDELQSSEEYLSQSQHPDDVKMCEMNIIACKTLLTYYGG